MLLKSTVRSILCLQYPFRPNNTIFINCRLANALRTADPNNSCGGEVKGSSLNQAFKKVFFTKNRNSYHIMMAAIL